MQQYYKADPFFGRGEAIRNMGGMETLYNKHVDRFKDNYCDSFKNICRYLNYMEYDKALQLTHSIRGLASTLGMSELQCRAEKLENAINEGRYRDLPPLLINFQSALDNVLYSTCFQSSSSVGA